MPFATNEEGVWTWQKVGRELPLDNLTVQALFTVAHAGAQTGWPLHTHVPYEYMLDVIKGSYITQWHGVDDDVKLYHELCPICSKYPNSTIVKYGTEVKTET